MSGDLLERAARALREETAEGAEGSQFSRARVLAGLHRARVRRRSRFAFVVPFGVLFAAASAWGMASGRAPELVRDIAEALGLLTPRPPVKAAPAKTPPAEATAVEASRAEPPESTPALLPPPPEASAAPEPAVVAADESAAAPTPAPRPRPTRRAARPAPATPELPAPDEAAADPTHDLYRAAHHAHFVEHDWPRALAAWDTYLSRARGGRFALEARYNRAICLLRLGRNTEARAALEPFATGAHAGYRQSDARTLLEALDRSATPQP